MKVLCIKNNDKDNCLTPGKWYEVIEVYYYDYWLIDDNGTGGRYQKTWFKTQDQVRDEKLKELGIV